MNLARKLKFANFVFVNINNLFFGFPKQNNESSMLEIVHYKDFIITARVGASGQCWNNGKKRKTLTIVTLFTQFSTKTETTFNNKNKNSMNTFTIVYLIVMFIVMFLHLRLHAEVCFPFFKCCCLLGHAMDDTKESCLGCIHFGQRLMLDLHLQTEYQL